MYVAVVVFLLACLAGSIVFAVRQRDRLQLDRLTHETLVTSWLLTPQQLLAFRCVILCFMAGTTVIIFSSSGFGWTIFFFTNWGYLLLTVYFGSLVAYTLRTTRMNGVIVGVSDAEHQEQTNDALDAPGGSERSGSTLRQPGCQPSSSTWCCGACCGPPAASLAGW